MPYLLHDSPALLFLASGSSLPMAVLLCPANSSAGIIFHVLCSLQLFFESEAHYRQGLVEDARDKQGEGVARYQASLKAIRQAGQINGVRFDTKVEHAPIFLDRRLILTRWYGCSVKKHSSLTSSNWRKRRMEPSTFKSFPTRRCKFWPKTFPLVPLIFPSDDPPSTPP